MNDILKTVVSLSISGTVLILFLTVFKIIYRNRFSRAWQYYIWIIVIARLLIPFTPEVSLMGSVFQYFENGGGVGEVKQQVQDTGQSFPSGVDMDGMVNEKDMGNTQYAKNPLENSPGFSGEDSSKVWMESGILLLLVWAVPVLVLMVRKITVYQSFLKYIKAGRLEVSDTDVLDLLAKAGEWTGVERLVGLYTHPMVSSPMMIGFFHPFMVLPQINKDSEQLLCIMKHELVHCKRFDLLYKWMVEAAICVHWFNPLVHLCGKEISRCCELACDEAVIKNLDMEEKRVYGDTLMNSLKMQGNYQAGHVSVTLSEGAEQIKERLGAIMSYKKHSLLGKVVSFGLALVICGGAVTAGAYAAPLPGEAQNSSSGKQNEAVYRGTWQKMTFPGTVEQPFGNSDQNKNWNTDISGDPYDSLNDDMATEPEGTDSGEGVKYTYTQAGYYQEPYIFQMGWNLNENWGVSYPEKATLTLSDNSEVTVSFDESCKMFKDDVNVLSSLSKLIETIRMNADDPKYPRLENPLILSVGYAEKSKLEQLVDDYYKEEEMIEFSAVFSSLDEKIQKSYVNKMMEDGRIAFFGAVMGGNISDEVIQYGTEKAYLEKKISFFSVASDFLKKEEKEDWAARCSKDGRNNFLAVLQD